MSRFAFPAQHKKHRKRRPISHVIGMVALAVLTAWGFFAAIIEAI